MKRPAAANVDLETPLKRRPTGQDDNPSGSKRKEDKAATGKRRGKRSLKDGVDGVDGVDPGDAAPATKQKQRRAAKDKTDLTSKAGDRKKATFARRYQPASALGAMKWLALKKVYAAYVAPKLVRPSSSEDWFEDGVPASPN